MSPARGFSLLAPFYSCLGLVLGSTLRRARREFIDSLAPATRILIVGGGNGQVLTDLLKHQPKASIDYLDIAPGMIASAKKSLHKLHPEKVDQVNFICADLMNHDLANQYDLIITQFFLDCFTENTLDKVMKKLHSALLTQGQWLFCDFTANRAFGRLCAFLLYPFFRLVCGIEARELAIFRKKFQLFCYQIERESCISTMIECTLYKKLSVNT
jgi:ubiquinone/menaquinone biosynthesis C-methylase UbiE